MDLRESPQERSFREDVRAFVRAKLPQDLREAVLSLKRVEIPDQRRWHRILHERGWAVPGWPIEFGGPGWTPLQRMIFDEECALEGAPRLHPQNISMIGPVLQRFGTREQQERFLPHLPALDHVWCQGYSEPGAGSDLASLQTRAQRVGDEYVVNGQKIWTSYAIWADWMFCLVRTSSTGKPQEGITFLLIDMSSKGLTVRPIVTLDGGEDVAEVFFDDVRVPLQNRVGEENGGWTIAKFLLGHERYSLAGVALCKRYLMLLKQLARSERKEGRALIEDPLFRDRLVQLETELIAHEWTLLRALSLEANKRARGTEPSVMKIRGASLQQAFTELLLEAGGPRALPFVAHARRTDWQGSLPGEGRYNAHTGNYLDWRKVSIYGGSSEIQRNIVAKLTLGV